MTWSSPPAAVSALRDMLVACASAVSAGLVQASVHYPAAVAEADDATASDTMPRAVLAETGHRRNRYAEAGVVALPSGTLSVTVDAELTDGEMEALGRNLASELASQSTGLQIADCSCSLCSDPKAGALAADATTGQTSAAYRSITITVSYGLTG